MPRYKSHTLQELETFIKKHLPEKLREDLRGIRLVKEADVECATYHHLRRFLGKDPKWLVLARKYVKRTGKYPDLLIYKNDCPRLAIELKWNRATIEKKDIQSLKAVRKRLGVNKVYWISAWYKHGELPRQRKRLHIPNRSTEVVVTHGLTGRQLDIYKDRRKELVNQALAVKPKHQ